MRVRNMGRRMSHTVIEDIPSAEALLRPLQRLGIKTRTQGSMHPYTQRRKRMKRMRRGRLIREAVAGVNLEDLSSR